MKMGRRFWGVLCALCFGLLLGCDDSASGPQGGGADESDANSISGRYDPNAQPAVVSGTAQLGGAESHGGILVEVVGPQTTATTASDGGFRLEVRLAGQTEVGQPNDAGTGIIVTLRFTYEGYAPAERQVTLDSGTTTTMDMPVVLTPLPGSITGRLVFPTGLNPADFQDGVQLSLVPTDGAATAGAYDAMGSFGFDDLAPGSYRVEVSGAPFVAVGLPVIIGPGQAVAVPDITLRLQDGLRTQYETAIEGVARLQGVTDEAAHGGIFVEDMDGDTTTTTRADGRFRLVVEPGTHTLRFSRAGYGATEVSAGEVAPRTRVTLPETVVLAARPGRVTGRVRLVQFETSSRLQDTAVHLYGEGEDPLLTVAPDPTGRFTFDQVAFGEWRVEATHPAYAPRSTWVMVEPGRSVDAGELALSHQSTSEAAVTLSGRVTLSDSEEHAGTGVHVLLEPAGLLAARLETNAHGDFDTLAAPGERYSIRLVRADYTTPDRWGPFAYDSADQRFETDDGSTLERVLDPSRPPVEGIVTATGVITTDWLPQNEQYLTIQLQSLDVNAPPQQENGVQSGAPTQFGGLALGRYEVVITRPGFSEARAQVELTYDAPSVAVGPLAVRLLNLAEAGVGLDGRVIDACQLRAIDSLRGANLSNVIISGNLGAIEPGTCPACAEFEDPGCAPLDLSESRLSNSDLSQVTGALGARFDDASMFGTNLRAVNLSGASMARTDLTGSNLAEVQLMGADLRNADLGDADLRNARFSHARWLDAPLENPCGQDGERPSIQLDGTEFSGADLGGAHLSGVDLRAADLSSLRMRNANLVGACLRDATLSLADATDSDFRFADIQNARAINIVLSSANMRGTDMRNAFLSGAVLESTEFGCLEMDDAGRCICEIPFVANDEHPQAYTETCIENENIDGRCRCRTRLNGANFAGASLLGTDFTGADMQSVTLSGAIIGRGDRQPVFQPLGCELPDNCIWPTRIGCIDVPEVCAQRSVRFVDARLDRAHMSGLNAGNVNFQGTSVRRANLEGAELRRSKFDATDFSHSNLADARLAGNTFTGVRFNGAILRRSAFDDVIFTDLTMLSGVDARAASMTTADLRNLRFHSALTDGIDINGSQLCEFRSTFIGIPALFEATCGPWEQTIRGGEFVWDKAWSNNDGAGTHDYLRITQPYNYALKTYGVSYAESWPIDPQLIDWARGTLIEHFIDDGVFDNGITCETTYWEIPPTQLQEASFPCEQARRLAGFTDGVNDRQAMERISVVLMNYWSLEHGYEPCFLNPETRRAYSHNDLVNGANFSWPEGIHCEGYRWPTRDEFIWALTNGGNKTFYRRPLVPDQDFHHFRAASAPGCAYTGDTNQNGLCDLFGNLREVAIPYRHDACHGFRDLEPTLRLGTGTHWPAARAHDHLFDAVVFDGIDGFSNTAYGEQESTIYSLRPARTLFEACDEENRIEQRACGRDRLFLSSRECLNGRWTLWTPCIDDQVMCCLRGDEDEINRCLSPLDGRSYRWVMTGAEVRELEVFTNPECTSADFLQERRFDNERMVHCNPNTLGHQIIESGDPGAADGPGWPQSPVVNGDRLPTVFQTVFAEGLTLSLGPSIPGALNRDHAYARPNVGDTFVLYGPGPSDECETELVEREVAVWQCSIVED